MTFNQRIQIWVAVGTLADRMCVMVRKFPAGAFSFEIEDDEIRLIYSKKVVDRRILPLVLDELPIGQRGTPVGNWSAAWYHLLAFEPEKAEELRALATKDRVHE